MFMLHQLYTENLLNQTTLWAVTVLSFMSGFCVLTGSRRYFVVHELHFPPHHCHFGAIHHSREWVKGWSDIQCCKLVSFLVHISYVVIINDVAHFFPTTVNNPVMAIKRQGVSVKILQKIRRIQYSQTSVFWTLISQTSFI